MSELKYLELHGDRVAYRDVGDAELAVLVTTYRGAGAGTALLDAVVEHARTTKWKRLWLVTTNDNTDAIRLYERRGYQPTWLYLSRFEGR